MGHGARIFEKRGQAAVACSLSQVRHGGFGVREESGDRLAHSRFVRLVEHPSCDVQAARLQPRRHVGFGVPELERLQLAAHVRYPVRGGFGIAVRGREARLGDLVVAPTRLEVSDDRGIERREHRGDALEGDAARFEDRASGRLAEPGGGAVDVELPAVGRDRSSFEHDLVGADRLHVPESHDVLDRAQQLELGDGDGRAVVHGGRDPLVEAQQLVRGFEPGEQVVDAVGLRRRFDAARHAVDGVGHELERLEVRAVPHPRVAGSHPPDVVGVDTVLEQPGARVGARLAAADDRVAGRRFLDVGQFVHGNASDVGVDRERRRVPRRDRRFEVAGVDDGASHRDLGRRPREGGNEGDVLCFQPQVVGHREEPHLSRRQVVLVQHAAEVVTELHAVGSLVEAGVEAMVVELISAQGLRVDAVARGRLVETHERVRIVPVAARGVPAIHHDHVAVVVASRSVRRRTTCPPPPPRSPGSRSRSRSRLDPFRELLLTISSASCSRRSW